LAKSNRPSNNLLTYRLLKGVVKTKNEGFALKITFSSKEAKEEFVKSTYCHMLFYPDRKESKLTTSRIYYTPEVVYKYAGTASDEELYVKIPRPGKIYVMEVAYNFLDSWGNLICTHSNVT